MLLLSLIIDVSFSVFLLFIYFEKYAECMKFEKNFNLSEESHLLIGLEITITAIVFLYMKSNLKPNLKRMVFYRLLTMIFRILVVFNSKMFYFSHS